MQRIRNTASYLSISWHSSSPVVL